jgi:hypothetical protein
MRQHRQQLGMALLDAAQWQSFTLSTSKNLVKTGALSTPARPGMGQHRQQLGMFLI